MGGLSRPAHVQWRHVAQSSIVPVRHAKEQWHCVGQAAGLCSESVPTGKPSAYGLRFALRNTFTAQPCGLTHTMHQAYLRSTYTFDKYTVSHRIWKTNVVPPNT